MVEACCVNLDMNNLKVTDEQPECLEKVLFDFTVGTSGFHNQFGVPLKLLSGSEQYVELWLSNRTVNYKQLSPNIHIVHDDNHLILRFDGHSDSVYQQTEESYIKAYQLSEQYSINHLVRTWNYLPDINCQNSGIDNYQQFCIARYEVLNKLSKNSHPYPAATAIGSKNDWPYFMFFFSKKPANAIENKRQVPAWEYPLKYSPKQPVFSRAVIYEQMLICSGTASVVGHETKHIGDFSAQFREMIENLEILIQTSKKDYSLRQGYYKFYLREKQNLQQLLLLINDYGLKKYLIYEGDVCRQELMLESEVVFIEKNTINNGK